MSRTYTRVHKRLLCLCSVSFTLLLRSPAVGKRYVSRRGANPLVELVIEVSIGRKQVIVTKDWNLRAYPCIHMMR